MDKQIKSAVSDIRANHILNMAGDGTKDFNCWGATQYVLHIRDTLGWVEIQEMSSWLEKNTAVIKHAEAGDILTLFHETPFGKMLIHTAVYLGDGAYLHKLGQSRAERATLRQIMKHYDYAGVDGHEIRRLKCD